MKDNDLNLNNYHKKLNELANSKDMKVLSK